MKNFAYTAKASDGALTRGVLSAADRAAALEALRRQGLMPVKVEETRAVPAGDRAVPPRVLAYAAVAVLLLAGGVWLALSRRGGGQPSVVQPPSAGGQASPRVAATPAPAVPTTPVAPAPSTTPAVPVASAAPAAPVPAAAPSPAPSPALPENPPAAPAPTPPPRDPSFASHSESAMAMIASIPPGMPVPPLPISGDLAEDFAVAATNTIVIFDDDTEETVRHKEAVAWMKVDVAEYVKEGHSPAEVIQAITDAHNENAKIREEYEFYLSQLRAAGDTAGVETFVKEANEDLAARGLPLLTIRKTTMAERKAAREKK
jgi:hypothetical protein